MFDDITSWDSCGMDWNNPNPSKPQYYIALVKALSERYYTNTRTINNYKYYMQSLVEYCISGNTVYNHTFCYQLLQALFSLVGFNVNHFLNIDTIRNNPQKYEQQMSRHKKVYPTSQYGIDGIIRDIFYNEYWLNKVANVNVYQLIPFRGCSTNQLSEFLKVVHDLINLLKYTKINNIQYKNKVKIPGRNGQYDIYQDKNIQLSAYWSDTQQYFQDRIKNTTLQNDIKTGSANKWCNANLQWQMDGDSDTYYNKGFDISTIWTITKIQGFTNVNPSVNAIFYVYYDADQGSSSSSEYPTIYDNSMWCGGGLLQGFNFVDDIETPYTICEADANIATPPFPTSQNPNASWRYSYTRSSMNTFFYYDWSNVFNFI